MSATPRFVLPAICLATLAIAPAAQARELLSRTVSATGATARVCHGAPAPGARGVASVRVPVGATGMVDARLSGARGDWDLGVFDAASGSYVAGAAAPGGAEVAQGFVRKAGRDVIVQACRRAGAGSRARLRVRFVDGELGGTAKLVRVPTPTLADANRLAALGLDMTEHAGAGFRELVLHGDADEQRLRSAGWTFTVRIADLALRDAQRAIEDFRFARATSRSALPSGATDYRHLADIEAELKQMAQQYPGLVKLVTLPHKSLEGRAIMGVEIAKNVNVEDGKPVVMQMGVHHAREWPSGEHALEWAYELVKGYGSNPRATRLVDSTRTIVVPVVNVDGFNLSREATIDLSVLAAIDIPPQIDNPDTLPITDPTYTAAILADQQAGTFAFKRRNCRVADGKQPAEGECANSDNRGLGVDPNRNYGGSWGGPGASTDPTSDTYRGASPFSEPEVQNIRETISARQVVGLITNHTFSNLVLRPPGLRAPGPTVDEAGLKALGDAMAAQNGYASIPGYGLYDTTGTTEDWSYAVTGGFGYTFEIGPDEFHPPYAEMVAEYEGAGEYEGKGNREAYFVLQEWAANSAGHSVLSGRAPKGTTLRLTKEFDTETSPVIDAEGKIGKAAVYHDRLDTTLPVGDSGTFTWHVNPSTRPAVAKDRKVSDVSAEPAKTTDISSPLPPLPKVPTLHEFTVPAGADRQIKAQTIGTVPVDDIDIYLYEDQMDADHLVSSSAGGTADELLIYDAPIAGKTYILEIRNFAAVGPYDGSIQLFGSTPGTERLVKATTEEWTLACERDGKAFATTKVLVARGATKDLGNACAATKGSSSKPLTLSLALGKRGLLRRLLTRGLPVRARCSETCRVSVNLLVDKRSAKRLRLGNGSKAVVVAKLSKPLRLRARRTLTLRFTPKARKALRGKRNVRFSLVGVATDDVGNTKSRRLGVRLR